MEDVEKEANRIILGYLDKCEIMKRILEEDGGMMTTREVSVRTYGRSLGPPDGIIYWKHLDTKEGS